MRQPPECLHTKHFGGLSTFKISHFLIKFRSKFHTFFDASFWDSFFEFLVRLGAKKVDFGSPLAPSWGPNSAQNRPKGAQNRPSGAKMRPFSQRRGALFPTYFHNYFSERSWAPFWSILGPIWGPAGRQGIDPHVQNE